MVPTMKTKYKDAVAPELIKSQGYKNKMQVPKLDKIVLNLCVSVAHDRDAPHAADHNHGHGGPVDERPGQLLVIPAVPFQPAQRLSHRDIQCACRVFYTGVFRTAFAARMRNGPQIQHAVRRN